ncbi:MAG: tryptophanase, partial [Bdellovibrionales bacterium]|nr:tryptophanase [Bdellovibrionales bacterium]
MMEGDESYAGSRSFRRLEKEVQGTFNLPYVLPVHQGRAAERILNSTIVGPGQYVPGNSHFDTTKAHIEYARGRCVDLTIEEGRSSTINHPFKGNIDLEQLKHFIVEHGVESIAYILMTITCNSGGGQPVSMENLDAVKEICRAHQLPLFIDAARFAENAYFINQREPGFSDSSITDIIHQMFDGVDGLTMSSKKDAISPMGGLLVVRDQELFTKLRTPVILFEGYVTYGGISGLMMESLAQGLREVKEFSYLDYRIGQVTDFGEMLQQTAGGIPIVEPVGGHAIFVDARRFFPKVPEDQFPAQMLCVELYRQGGIRGVEVGACLAGRNPDTGENLRPPLDLCRLTIPRRVYFKEHFEYVAEVLGQIKERCGERTTGLKFKVEAPGIRHFDSTFEYIS